MNGWRFLFLLFTTVASISNSFGVDFEWAAPNSHRETWIQMISGNGHIVGTANFDVYSGRDVYSSADGKIWKRAPVQMSGGYPRVTYGNGMFLMTGAPLDHIYTSLTGEDWTSRRADTDGLSFGAIAGGNGIVVVAAQNLTANRSVLVSHDLEHWTRAEGITERPLEIAFGNGRFVAACENGSISVSTDGAKWQPGNSPIKPPDIYSFGQNIPLQFSNGLFALTAAQGVYTSADGITWTLASPKGFNLVAAPDGFLGINQGLWKSSDGSNWTKLFDYPNGDHNQLMCAAQLNGSFIAGGTSGLLFWSPNGVDWQQLVGLVDISRRKLAYGNGEFMRYGEQDGAEFSGDGATWELVSNTPPLFSAVFGDGQWVCINTNGNFVTSSDARTWVDAGPAPLIARHLYFAKGLFVADSIYDTGFFSYATEGAIGVSRDGRNWRRIEFPGASRTKVLGVVNGRWGALIDGRPVTSDDGETWTVHPSQPGLRWEAIGGNDRFICMDAFDMAPPRVSWSLDGITWQQSGFLNLPVYRVSSLSYGGGLFVVTSGDGGVYESADGLNWTGRREGTRPFLAAAFGGGKWLVTAGDSVLRSIPGTGAKLGLTQTNTDLRLSLQGTATESFEIQSAPAVDGRWNKVQTLQIPENGHTDLPLQLDNSNKIFRAIAVP